MPSGLEIALAEGTRVFWPYEQVRQTQGFYTGEPVRIERGHGLTEAVVVEKPEEEKKMPMPGGGMEDMY